MENVDQGSELAKRLAQMDITLPDAETLIQRFRDMKADDYSKQHLLPYVLDEAGESMAAIGLVVVLLNAVYVICQGMPPVGHNLLIGTIADRYVDVLVDEIEAREAIKEFLYAGLGEAKG